MGKYQRTKGGEKNDKSGQEWTKEELIQVYYLFKKLNGQGLHENNPSIQELAKKLNRTTRSTEAQLLMYRNLQRGGNYSHGNMNKICKEIWINFEKLDIHNSSELNRPFPQELFDWAGHKKGGVKKPFDLNSGRPNGSVIKTSLTKKIEDWIDSFNSNSPRIILLVGGPGNGKTDALEYLISRFDERHQTNYFELISNSIRQNGDLLQRKISIKITKGPFKNRELLLVQDASTGADNLTSEQCLIDDLDYSLKDDNILLICVNRGILSEAVSLAETTNQKIYEVLSQIIKSLTQYISPLSLWPLGDDTPLGEIAVWPMDIESLVKPHLQIYETPAFQVISEAVNEQKWKCSTCVLNKMHCPFFQNKITLQDTSILQSLLQLLSDFETISNKRWTFREIFSLTSYLIVGSEHEYGKMDLCEWVKEKQLLLKSQDPRERIIAIWDLNRRLYHFKLFSRWPTFSEITRSKNTEITSVLHYSFLAKDFFACFTHLLTKNVYKPDIAKILDNHFFENIDPSQFSNENFTIPIVNISLRDIEAQFSYSVSGAYEIINSHVNSIERLLFENIIEIEKDLDSRARYETSISSKRIDDMLVLLRAISVRYFKRILFTRLGISKDEAYLTEFRKLNYEEDKDQLNLKKVKDLFDNLIQGSNGLSLTLNTSISQPQVVTENQISIELQRLQIKYQYILDTIRDVPRNDVRVFTIEFKERHYIPITYQLYKALILLDRGLNPASLPPEVLSMLDSIKSKLAGVIVRDVDILQNSKLIIGSSKFIYRIDDSTYELEINKIPT